MWDTIRFLLLNMCFKYKMSQTPLHSRGRFVFSYFPRSSATQCAWRWMKCTLAFSRIEQYVTRDWMTAILFESHVGMRHLQSSCQVPKSGQSSPGTVVSVTKMDKYPREAIVLVRHRCPSHGGSGYNGQFTRHKLGIIPFVENTFSVRQFVMRFCEMT